MINKLNSIIVLTLLIGVFYVNYKSFISSPFQSALLQDWNKQSYRLPLDLIEQVDLDFPNISPTTIPLKLLKGRYYKNMDSIDIALDYGGNRKLFGQYLSEKQLFQSKIADMVTEYNLGLLASLEVANNIDNNSYIPEMISMVKRNNCNKSLNISRTSRDILGGNGIVQDYNIFRHLINLETVNTYEGTYDIHSLILGNYLTDKKAF